MRVLFDIGHPAQVHLFKHPLWTLEDRGHAAYVTSREKDVTSDLLAAYGIVHEVLTDARAGMAGKLAELLVRGRRLLAVAKRFEPDVLVSRLASPAPAVASLLGARSVVVEDTWVRSPLMRSALFRGVLPFVDVLCAPAGFDVPAGRVRHRPLDFQELAYLHPDYFTPDPAALREAGLDPTSRYAVVRLASWDAFHDRGYHGLSPAGAAALVEGLADHGAVHVSSEGELPPSLAPYALQLPPERVHDLLYHASLFVGDSGTMSTEAAMLGTPAIRTNSLVGDEDEPVFRALEEEFGLLTSLADEQAAIALALDRFSGRPGRGQARRRRAELARRGGDVTSALVRTILNSGATRGSPSATVSHRSVSGQLATGRDTSTEGEGSHAR